MRLFTRRYLKLVGLATIANHVSSVEAMCPKEPTYTEKAQCTTPQNWKDLKNIVENRNRVVLCPFTISLTQTDPPLRLKKQHEIVCAGEGQCFIKGGNIHAQIFSSTSDVSIYGFVFKEAAKGAIKIFSFARNHEHQICNTIFDSNHHSFGSAIKAAEGTKLFISESSFTNNIAKKGTLYSAGAVRVSHSIFTGNKATIDGAAIYLAPSNGNGDVRNTAFKSNTGGSNFISAEAAFNDGGGNTGSANIGSMCGTSGAYLRRAQSCVYFSKYPVHPVPANPPPGYFNYDMHDMEYGPNAWYKIPAKETHAYKYWKDLEQYMPADMTDNTCNSKASFNRNKASPIDVRNTDDNCKEFHQLRPNLETNHTPLLGPDDKCAKLNILPHSLRIEYPRVDKKNRTVPSIDIPMGWGKFLHVAYCEFKVPASHSIRGQKFVAELNCYIIQKAGRGLGVFTILFKLGKFNNPLQHAISAFDNVWQEHKDKCEAAGVQRSLLGETIPPTPAPTNITAENGLPTTTPAPTNSTAENDLPTTGTTPAPTNATSENSLPTTTPASTNSTAENDLPTTGTTPAPTNATSENNSPTTGTTPAPTNNIEENDLPTTGRMPFSKKTVYRRYWLKGWNPFRFMYQTKSWWFYGYKGTLMEPPCSQIVEYRIIDTPVQISKSQLNDMKRILFTHQDPDTCMYTSVHNDEESVARPIQPSERTRVHRCTCRDFLSDRQRDQSGMRTCHHGNESKWMPNPTDFKPAPGQCWDDSC